MMALSLTACSEEDIADAFAEFAEDLIEEVVEDTKDAIKGKINEATDMLVEKIGANTVVYNANGGTFGKERTFIRQGKLFKIPKEVPERMGYHFMGWSIGGPSTNYDDNYYYKNDLLKKVKIEVTRQTVLTANWLSASDYLVMLRKVEAENDFEKEALISYEEACSESLKNKIPQTQHDMHVSEKKGDITIICSCGMQMYDPTISKETFRLYYNEEANLVPSNDKKKDPEEFERMHVLYKSKEYGPSVLSMMESFKKIKSSDDPEELEKVKLTVKEIKEMAKLLDFAAKVDSLLAEAEYKGVLQKGKEIQDVLKLYESNGYNNNMKAQSLRGLYQTPDQEVKDALLQLEYFKFVEKSVKTVSNSIGLLKMISYYEQISNKDESVINKTIVLIDALEMIAANNSIASAYYDSLKIYVRLTDINLKYNKLLKHVYLEQDDVVMQELLGSGYKEIIDAAKLDRDWKEEDWNESSSTAYSLIEKLVETQENGKTRYEMLSDNQQIIVSVYFRERIEYEFESVTDVSFEDYLKHCNQ